jgi:hypothetical protein
MGSSVLRISEITCSRWENQKAKMLQPDVGDHNNGPANLPCSCAACEWLQPRAQKADSVELAGGNV